MIDPSSPYYQYDPTSIGWLRQRDKAGGEILNADLIRIIEANPELFSDDTLRDYLVRGLAGNLGKTRGRKRARRQEYKELYIVATYEALLPKLQARMKRQRGGARKARGAAGPSEYLCELIGGKFRMEPESVRNLVSSHKNRGKSQ